jgi:hypothetical protein
VNQEKTQQVPLLIGMPIRANPNLTTAIGLDEPPEPCHALDTFGQRLAEMITTVNSIIHMFEEYF